MCHYSPVMSRSIYTRPLSSPHSPARCYPVSVLPSQLSAPPQQHSNIQQKSDLLTPGLPHSHYIVHTDWTVLYCIVQSLSLLICHHRHSGDVARPGIRPGSDTRRPLRFLAPHLSLVKCIFWKPGSREPSPAAFWDLGWERR